MQPAHETMYLILIYKKKKKRLGAFVCYILSFEHLYSSVTVNWMTIDFI